MRRRSRYAATSFLCLLFEAVKQPDTIFLAVQANPHNYDAWFDYLRLVENDADPDTVRDVYERAIANIPPIQEKRHWRRYIYLWINYALYEELEVKVMLKDHVCSYLHNQCKQHFTSAVVCF